MSLDVLMIFDSGAEYHTIENIDDDDAIFFRENAVRISMWQEEGGRDDGDSSPSFVVKAELDIQNDDGDIVEVIERDNGRSCNQVLKSVRNKCEEIIGNQ